MRTLRAILAAAGGLALIGAGGRLAGRLANDHFDHWQHRRVFPSCQGCHAGALDSTQSIWPAASYCANCHDGTIEKKVDWSPPDRSRPSNLRFRHLVHIKKSSEKLGQDSVVCASCHLAEGAPWMRVRRAEVRQCLRCHGVRTEHLASANTACGTCHLTLAQATALPRERIGQFPRPPLPFRRGLRHAARQTCPTTTRQRRCPSWRRAELRYVPRAGLLHHVSRERSGSAGDSGARARLPVAGHPCETRGPLEPHRTGFLAPARPGGAPRAPELCRLSHAGELPHLPRGSARGGRRDVRGRTGPRHGGVDHPSPPCVPRGRLYRPPCASGGRSAEELQRLPRADGLPGLPPPQRRVSTGLPPVRLPRAPSRLRIRAGGLLRGVPQHGGVLCGLSSSGGARGPRCFARWVSRRQSRLHSRPWTGGAAKPGELRLLPRRARLSHLPLGAGWPTVQPAWARLRRRSAPPP
jgi:hypothetical protein